MTSTPQEPEPGDFDISADPPIHVADVDDDQPVIPIGPPSDPEAEKLLSDPEAAARRQEFVPETFG
jgi:hypothetical protein